jgi:hypothetical protein
MHIKELQERISLLNTTRRGRQDLFPHSELSEQLWTTQDILRSGAFEAYASKATEIAHILLAEVNRIEA